MSAPRDHIIAEFFTQSPGHPLGHAARVHEHERRVVLFDPLLEPSVHFLPHPVRHDQCGAES